MAGVGFLTFGFTESVCGEPAPRFHGGAIGPDYINNGSVVIHGYSYDFSRFNHPRTTAVFNGSTNPLYTGGWNLAGNDASFLFQRTNQRCAGLITRSATSQITGTGNNLNWYFPCNVYSQSGNSPANLTNYELPTTCHVTQQSRNQFASMKVLGQVYYTWDDVKNPQRNLAVFESYVSRTPVALCSNRFQIGSRS